MYEKNGVISKEYYQNKNQRMQYISGHSKIVSYYLAVIFVFLIFLKVLASDFFKEIVNFAITFLPFGIIFFLSFYSFYLYQKHPQERHRITRHTLVTMLEMLVITLIFYILYSPASFAPIFESFVTFQRKIDVATYFLVMAYVAVLTIFFISSFFFYRLYQKSQGKYWGSINLLLKHSLYTIFFIFLFLLGTSTLAYPQAYNPITDLLSDAIYTVTFGKVNMGDYDLTNSRRITSLKRMTDSLGETYSNLMNNVSKTNTELSTAITETKEKLDSSIIRTNKDLKNTLTNDITDRLDTGGGTVEGKLVVEKTLTVESISNLQDVIPQTDDTYDLGSVSKGWNNIYVHRIIGSPIVIVGDGSTSHSLTATDDLLVSGNLEVNNLVYLDAGADLGSQNIINLADPTNAQDAATKAYVDSQVVAVSYIQRNAGTETLYPLNTGDKLDMLNGLVLNIGNAGTDFTSGGGLTLAGTLTVGSLNGILKGTTGIVSAASGGTDYEYPLTFSNSLSRSTNTITLVNDSATPGNSKYYGTDAGGTKGFYALPSGGTTDHASLTTGLAYVGTNHTGFEASLTFNSPLSRSTNTISIPVVNGSQDGYLSSANWTTFNAKEPAITAGTTSQYFKGDKSLGTFNTDARDAVSESGIMSYNSSTGVFTLNNSDIDHGSLDSTSLTHDDHTQYVLLAGRSGGQGGTLYGDTAANGDLTIEGTSSGTKTSSYTFLEPNGGMVSIGDSTPPANDNGLYLYKSSVPGVWGVPTGIRVDNYATGYIGDSWVEGIQINSYFNTTDDGSSNGNVYGLVSITGKTNTGPLASATGIYSKLENSSTGAITNGYNFYANAPTASSTGDITNIWGMYVANMGVANNTTTTYGIQIAAQTASPTITGLDIGALSGTTANKGVVVGAISGAGATGAGVTIGALTNTGATQYGVTIGAISGTHAAGGGTSAGINIGNISSAGGTSTNYGINLGTLTGGTTANYQINAGNITAIASATNAHINLGTISGTAASSTNYGINIGAISGTGTATYGINIGANSATDTTNYGMKIGAISGAGTNNYGLYVDTVSGAGTGNYSAIFAGGNVGIGVTTPNAALGVTTTTGYSTFTDFMGNAATLGAALYDQTLTDAAFTSPFRGVNIQSSASFASDPGTKTFLAFFASAGVPSTISTDMTNLTVRASNNVGIHNGTGAVGTVQGLVSSITKKNTGSVTTAEAINVSMANNNATGSIGTAYGLRVANLVNTGTIATTYGVYVGDITTGTQTNTPFSFYASDSGTYNYFSGNTGIGVAAPTSYKFMVDWNGDGTNPAYVNNSNAWTNGSADYAEYFYTNDTNLVSGEAVCVDTQKENAVKRCENSGDNNVMGVVSTSPSVLGNAPVGREKDKNYVIVAMLGQIPGKVTGEIQIGDSLTSAERPGYMRKAEAGESTVGVALEKSNSADGKIQILISRRNKSLTVEKVEEEVTKNIAEMNVKEKVDNMVADAQAQLDKNITSKFSDYEITNNGQDVKILNLETTLQAQIDEIRTKLIDQTLISKINTEYENILTILNLDEEGNINIFGSLSVEKVVVNGIETGAITIVRIAGKDKTIGEAVICQKLKKWDEEENKCKEDSSNTDNNTNVIIVTDAITEHSKVFVTPKITLDKPLSVVATDYEGAEKSFTVEVKENSGDVEIPFDWWIVESR
jgi:hypothetical protein